MEKGTALKINENIQRSFRKSLNGIELSADEERFIRGNMIFQKVKHHLTC